MKSSSEASNTEPNKNHKMLVLNEYLDFSQLQVFYWPKTWSKPEFPGN